MSAPVLRKASRTKTKMRVALAGPSGSGKTYSALLLASGMAPWEKIALIDTENGSGDLYAHLGGYNVFTLAAPFTPERYAQAIDVCEKAGMEVIILDSMSHEWDGRGGILEEKDRMAGNSFTNWGKLTPRHNAFVDRILRSTCHVVATLRTKQDYVLVENEKGKQEPKKIGMKAITREGVDYEFTLVFDLDITHVATASKDRTGLFMSPDSETVVPQKITPEIGTRILAWSQEGAEPTEPQPKPQTQPAKAIDAAPVPNSQAAQPQPTKAPDTIAPATKEQVDQITNLCDLTGTDRVKLMAHYKVTGTLTVEQAMSMIASLNAKFEKAQTEKPAVPPAA